MARNETGADQVADFMDWVHHGVNDPSFAAQFPTVDFPTADRLLQVASNRDHVVSLVGGVRLVRTRPRSRTAPKLAPGLVEAAARAPWSVVRQDPQEILWSSPDGAHHVRIYQEGRDWFAEGDGKQITPKLADRREAGIDAESRVVPADRKTEAVDALDLAVHFMSAMDKPSRPRTPFLPPAPDERARDAVRAATPEGWTLVTPTVEQGLVEWDHAGFRVALRLLSGQQEIKEMERGQLVTRVPAVPEAWRIETSNGNLSDRYLTLSAALEAARVWMQDFRPPVAAAPMSLDGPEWAQMVAAQIQLIDGSSWLRNLGFEDYYLITPRMEGRKLHLEWLKYKPQSTEVHARFTAEASENAGRLSIRTTFSGPKVKVLAPPISFASADDLDVEKLFPEEWLLDNVIRRAPSMEERLPVSGTPIVERDAVSDDIAALIGEVLIWAIPKIIEGGHRAVCAPGVVDRVLTSLCSENGKYAIGAALAIVSPPAALLSAPKVQQVLCSARGRQLVQRAVARLCVVPAEDFGRMAQRGTQAGVAAHRASSDDAYARARTVADPDRVRTQMKVAGGRHGG